MVQVELVAVGFREQLGKQPLTAIHAQARPRDNLVVNNLPAVLPDPDIPPGVIRQFEDFVSQPLITARAGAGVFRGETVVIRLDPMPDSAIAWHTSVAANRNQPLAIGQALQNGFCYLMCVEAVLWRHTAQYTIFPNVTLW